MHPPKRPPLLNRRQLQLGLLGTAAGLAAVTPLARAQSWPGKPIRIIVNVPPGGAVDQIARAIGQPLQTALGQPVVVENRAGAGGLLGGELVAKSAPDGTTLLVSAGSMGAIAPHLYAKPPIDPQKDLVPIAGAARALLFLLIKPTLPVTDLKSFVAYLKANPGKLSYGSAGNGTSPHLAGEMFKSQAGVFAVHVPYRGAAPALQDLLAGQVDFVFDSGIGLEHVKTGRVKLLAVGNLTRSSQFPTTPTIQEAGMPGFDAGTTYGVYAPVGTPAEVVARLNQEINKALALRAVQERITALGAEPTPGSPADFAAVMQGDYRRFGQIVRERNIKSD
jgi:tripartite-type tricarboxylate transporter receptor subunit TctC